MNITIILQGKANSGKTTTLKELANILIELDNNYDLIKGNLQEYDFIVKLKINNKIIGIVSIGDDEYNLNKDLNILYKKYPNIDLFFGASRTKGKTVEIHNNMAKKNKHNIIWTSTYNNKENLTLLNKFKAKELYNLVQEMKII